MPAPKRSGPRSAALSARHRTTTFEKIAARGVLSSFGKGSIWERYAMPSFLNLPAFSEEGDVHVVVETPRGSRAKFAYEPKFEAFTLRKSLLTGLTYPHDWGFVPSTKADDGDPLDIMIVHDAATFPGVVLTCRIIGILQIKQKSKKKSERNDRLFAVPRRSHSEGSLEDVADLSKPIREELEKFFIATDELEDKKLEIIGWKGRKVAIQTIKDAATSLAKEDED
jgi:inorganic pyrophosphatase